MAKQAARARSARKPTTENGPTLQQSAEDSADMADAQAAPDEAIPSGDGADATPADAVSSVDAAEVAESASPEGAPFDPANTQAAQTSPADETPLRMSDADIAQQRSDDTPAGQTSSDAQPPTVMRAPTTHPLADEPQVGAALAAPVETQPTPPDAPAHLLTPEQPEEDSGAPDTTAQRPTVPGAPPSSRPRSNPLAAP